MIIVTVQDILTLTPEQMEPLHKGNETGWGYVYVVRDENDTVLYVGKGNARARVKEHIWTKSVLGTAIKNNPLSSPSWKVISYTFSDCKQFISQYDRDLAERMDIPRRCDGMRGCIPLNKKVAALAEAFLIDYLHPRLNIQRPSIQTLCKRLDEYAATYFDVQPPPPSTSQMSADTGKFIPVKQFTEWKERIDRLVQEHSRELNEMSQRIARLEQEIVRLKHDRPQRHLSSLINNVAS